MSFATPNPSSPTTSRRGFLKSATVAVAAPLYIPSSVFGANDRIVTGHIGVRNQGMGNLGRFKKNAVAVCDVDSDVMAKAAKKVEGWNGSCETFDDYRKLLDRSDIDAVVISTPDHWHALQTIHACQAGKDVYCEKPLSLTIPEGRKMVDAARSNNRIVQTGSQQRSDNRFRLACELVRNGHIGKLQEVHVGIPKPNHPGNPGKPTTPPSNLNFDYWLGPAPKVPYHEKKVHYNFRFWRDYSGGQITNFGAHNLDIALWALNEEDPMWVEGKGTFHPEGWHETTETCQVKYGFKDDVVVKMAQGLKGWSVGCKFIGSKGRIFVDRRRILSDPEEIAETTFADDAIRLYKSSSHAGNFLDCVKSRELPICDVAIGHRSATLCHLANHSIKAGRRLNWNAKTEQFVDDAEANKLLSKEDRAPYNASFYSTEVSAS